MKIFSNTGAIADAARSRRFRLARTGAAAVLASSALTTAIDLHAADILWTSSGGSAWLTGSNWTGGNVPTATDNAQFGINPTAATGVGINFSNATNAGIQATGQRIEDVGAIEVTSNRTAAFLVGNSSSSAGATGTLRLLGTTVNGVANTILRNNSAQTFTLQNVQGSGNQTMAVTLGNVTNNVVNVDSTGNIVISSAVNGGKLTLNAASSGDLRLSGTNTFTGGIDITGVTAGGRLRVDAVASLPTSGTVAISTGGRMTLNVAGTYGGTSQTLTFNPNQTTNPSLDILSGAAVTWLGTVAINADTRIEPTGSASSLAFSGNLSGAGTLIKQAGGNLILSGTGNNATGGTQVGNGTVTVNSGSRLGTGALSFAQTTGNSTAVTLNNATQSISALSSTFVDTTGTQSQTLTLTGTALTINQATNTTFGGGAVSTLTSVITGTGSVLKSGAGSLTLTGANSYTGGTSITAGKLLVANTSGSATGTTGVSIGTAGTLASGAGTTGIITGLVTTAGTGSILAPGATETANTGTVGALTLTGGLNLAAGGAIPFDLLTPSTSDLIRISGGTFTGGATAGSVTFNFATSATSGTFALINYTGATASGVDLTDFAALGANGNFSFNGSELDFTITPVPEPATVAAGLLGLGALGVSQRRRLRGGLRAWLRR